MRDKTMNTGIVIITMYGGLPEDVDVIAQNANNIDKGVYDKTIEEIIKKLWKRWIDQTGLTFEKIAEIIYELDHRRYYKIGEYELFVMTTVIS
jgi:hypothetical protein